VHTKDKKYLCLDLGIALTFDKVIAKKHVVVYQLDVNFQAME
jgi:hypothetical protein